MAQLCERCHAKSGCETRHSFGVADTGECSQCGEMAEVWDCELLALYAEAGLADDEVWCNLPRLKRELTWSEILDVRGGPRKSDSVLRWMAAY